MFFTSQSSYAQNWLWSGSYGGKGEDVSTASVLDSQGNLYITGYFNGDSIRFGSLLLMKKDTNKLFYDIFIVKYNISGNVLWAKNFGGNGNTKVNSITIDVAGNLYITGYYTCPSLGFGNDTLFNNGNKDIFLSKFDTNGVVIWAKGIGSNGDDYANSITKDSSGHIYIAGSFSSSTISFDTIVLNNLGITDLFIAKFDASAKVIWAKSFGGSNAEDILSVTNDSSDNLIITGIYKSQTINFGSDTLINIGSPTSNIFISKFNKDGKGIWAKSYGGMDNDNANSVTSDVSNNIFIAGSFSSSYIKFGTDSMKSKGNSDIFLTKFDENGNVIWAKTTGGTGKDNATYVTTDKSGNIYLGGFFFSSTISFGSLKLTNSNSSNQSSDFFIVSYNNSGEPIWAKSEKGICNELVYSLQFDATANVYIIGAFSSPTIAFGKTTISNADKTCASNDIFISKIFYNTGINSSEDNLKISIYPNPATDVLNIDLTVSNQLINEVTIRDITGQKIFFSSVKENNKLKIKTKGLASGIYFLNVRSSESQNTQKFIVIK